MGFLSLFILHKRDSPHKDDGGGISFDQAFAIADQYRDELQSQPVMSDLQDEITLQEE